MEDYNIVTFNLEYSYLINSLQDALFSTNNGLWRDYGVSLQKNVQIMDNLRAIENRLELINKDKLNYTELLKPQIGSDIMTLAIRGQRSYVSYARMKILQNFYQIGFRKILLSDSEFESIVDPATRAHFLMLLNHISETDNVEIIVDKVDTDFKSVMIPSNSYFVYIVGNQDRVSHTETRVKIAVDKLLNGYYVDAIETELSLIPIIGGPRLLNFTQVVKQSQSNLYIPDVMPSLFNSEGLASTGSMKIWVTSKERCQILQTKKILEDIIGLILQKDEENLYTKEILVTKTKLDLVTQFDHLKLLAIMLKHGTYIQLPPLGEQGDYKIVIQSQSEEDLNETVYDLTLLFSDYYKVSFNFENTYSRELEHFLINLGQLNKAVVLTYNNHGIEIEGASLELKLTLSSMNSNFYFLSTLLDSLTFAVRIELNNSQHEFLSGKKNGKINKIMNQLSNPSDVRFIPYSEYNFYADLIVYKQNSMALNDLMKGIELLELELPAELKMYIPEVFHKSIIGNGGSIIQSIMKKYNVFIKFTTNTLKQDKINYTFHRQCNVLIKCPKKNGKNIALAKQELEGLVNNFCLKNKPIANGNTVYNTTHFELWKSHYLLLINRNYNLREINKLEQETGSYIMFPSTIEDFGDSNKLNIQIKGAENKSRLCAEALSNMLPKNFKFVITYSPGRFAQLISTHNSEFFQKIITPFRMLLDVEISTESVRSQHEIVLSSYSQENLDVAICDLTHYLRDKDFLILDKSYLSLQPIIESNSGLDPVPASRKLQPLSSNQWNIHAAQRPRSPIKTPSPTKAVGPVPGLASFVSYTHR